MMRTTFFAALGLIITVMGGVLAFVVLRAGGASLAVVDPDATVDTPVAVIVVPTTATNTLSTVTAVVQPTAAQSTNVPAATTTGAPTPPSATTIAVVNSDVRYVLARTDLNIRGGPGTNYHVVGWLARGQTAGVTGTSSDGGWWRVVCPDGSTGSCWVTASTQYTQATSAPGSTPMATSEPTTCTDRAALIADVTVPDGTQFPLNSGFNKIWRIKNTGTCPWDGRYRLVHAGGHLLGAVSPYFPLRDTVFPGHSTDLVINMVSPDSPDTYQSDWKLQNPEGQFFGVGSNNAPFWVKIAVVSTSTTISGVVYEDFNENGVFDGDEPLVGDREIRLFAGTACHVRQNLIATARSGNNGRYTFSGNYSGSYCVGLATDNALDDVAGVTVTAGQALQNVNLRSPLPSGSISGYLWNDYCLVDASGKISNGVCVPDGSGSYRADGAIQPEETCMAGAVIALQAGTCADNHNPYAADQTGNDGRYFFGDLGPGTYCVSVDINLPENETLLPGDWTFPAPGINHHQVTLGLNENAYPVNFGWDYQLK